MERRPPKAKQIGVRLPTTEVRQLARIAENEGRTISAHVRYLIRRAMSEERKESERELAEAR